MSPRRFFAPSLLLFAILMIIAPFHSVMAQGKFEGKWTVVDLVRPDWIEPTSPDPGQPLKKGDEIAFSSASVSAPEPFGCGEVSYVQLAVKPAQIFREGIFDSGKVAEVVEKFGFSSAIAALRVECPLATFEFYEGRKGLVVEYDNMVYTLAR